MTPFINSRRRDGNALVFTVLALVALATMAWAAASLTNNIGRIAHRNTARMTALSIGDSALEAEFAQWRQTCQNYGGIAPRTVLAQLVPPTQLFTQGTNSAWSVNSQLGLQATLTNYNVWPLDSMMNTGTAGTASPAPLRSGTTNATLYQYLAQASVTVPVLGGGTTKTLTVNVNRVLRITNLSLFNDLMFFNGDLEINPGPNMLADGAVHTNGNLYVGAATGVVTFQTVLDASGSVNLGKSPMDPSSRNDKTKPVYPPGYPIAGVGQETPLGIPETALSPSTPNATSYEEMIEPPVSGKPDPFSPTGQPSERFYNLANIIITISSNPTNPISIAQNFTGASGTAHQTAVSQTVFNAFVSSKTPVVAINTTTFQDAREGATINATNFNVAALNSAISSGVIPSPSGGLIVYITDTRPATGTNQPGILLNNGAALPANGLTFVSNNAVYVQGDYNTGGSNPPSNSTVGASPTVGTYWQPAAIMADAINVLSNAWTKNSSGSTMATPTTINAAFLTGNVPSNGVNYSGGVENFPRFHENWSNVSFTYYGSMVCMFASTQAIKPWLGTDYSAPNRNWYFDTHFLTTVPPGNFIVSQYSKQQWFTK